MRGSVFGWPWGKCLAKSSHIQMAYRHIISKHGCWQVTTWICLRGAQKIKNIHYRFPSHGGFSIGKISQITLNKPKTTLDDHLERRSSDGTSSLWTCIRNQKKISTPSSPGSFNHQDRKTPYTHNPQHEQGRRAEVCSLKNTEITSLSPITSHLLIYKWKRTSEPTILADMVQCGSRIFLKGLVSAKLTKIYRCTLW